MKMHKEVVIHRQPYLRSGVKMLLALVGMIAIVSLTLIFQQPPKPLTSTADERGFSAERAMKYLNWIAAEPHPTTSKANEKVRDYLVEQMTLMGLNPAVDAFNKVDKTSDDNRLVEVHNVIGVLKGSEDGKAVMLSAHYDSVAEGSGANDDGTAVAALLETARALKSGAPLKNDVWFVFTDGEELGMLGAEGFWENHDYQQKIGFVANFEARGSRGSSMMFQTSDHNGKLIRELGKASPPSVLANSFMGDIYKILPNDTDFTKSLQAGIPGLNFAYIEGWRVYHTQQDDLDHVSMSSFQHHGENALSIAKHFGNLDLSNLHSDNEIYFSLFGTLIHYPQFIAAPLAGLLVILYIGQVVVALARRVVRPRGLAYSLLMNALCMILSTAISYLLYRGIYALLGSRSLTEQQAIMLDCSFLVIALLVHAALYVRMKNQFNDMENLLTGILFFLLLLLGSLLYLPGASYLLALPLVIQCIAMGYALMKPDPIGMLNRSFILFITAVPPIVLFTSVFYLLFIGLDPSLNVVGAFLLSFILPMLQPLHKWLFGAPRMFIPLLVTALIILCTGTLLPM